MFSERLGVSGVASRDIIILCMDSQPPTPKHLKAIPQQTVRILVRHSPRLAAARPVYTLAAPLWCEAASGSLGRSRSNIFIYIYICMFVYIHLHEHEYIHTYVRPYARISITQTNIYIYIYIYIYVHILKTINMCVYIYMSTPSCA